MYETFQYKILLSGANNQRRINLKIQDGKTVNFKSPLTQSKRPKIYVFRRKDQILYVGQTTQSISTRLNSGLKADGKNGYHGYKWKNEQDEFNLTVFVFDKLSGDEEADKRTIKQIEAIEAELVYKVRFETGAWPVFQNEIHFNNDYSERAERIARNLYQYVYEE